MSISLSAITSISGLPIFTRSYDSTGKCEKISFINVSTLNALNLFCNANQGKLYSASTEKHKIYWKCIDSLTLIIFINQTNRPKVSFADESLEKALNLFYNLILMFVSKDELNKEQVDKIKLKIKNCYFAIDYLIECYLNKTNLTIESSCLEIKLGSYKCAQLTEELINNLSNAVDSLFICLNVNSKIVNTTRNYYDMLLSSIDGQLINLLLQAKLANDNQDENLIEIEILLPQSCPDATSRLIFVKLSKHCSFTILCGDKPSTDLIKDELIEPLKQNLQNLQLFNELETKSFIQSEYIVDDRVINFFYFNFQSKLFFKNGLLGRDKISTIVTFMQILDLNEDEDQIITYSNFKLCSIFRKNESHLVLIMYPRSLDLNDIKKSSQKTYNEILKIRKKNLFLQNQFK